MKYRTVKEAAAAVAEAGKFERLIGSRRILVAAEITGKQYQNARFWLVLQTRNDVPGGPLFTTHGQTYLDRDGKWREPHGKGFLWFFSSPAAAIRAANAIGL